MSSSVPPGLSLDTIPSAPPPRGVLPDFIHGHTLGTEIIAVSAVSSALALVLLSIRLYSTLSITRSAWYDDAACVCAIVFSLAYVGLFISIRGHAKHGWDLPVTSYSTSYFKTLLAETMICSFAMLCSKISILLLLHRVFTPVKRFRYCVYVGMLWATAVSGLSIIIAGALCAPRSGESFNSLQVIQRCSHQGTWAVVQGSMNVALDFFILYIPIPMVWKLQLGRKKKWGVTAIFMTGFI
ncbi:MAG: hypothetical protein LQ338_001623 [Usnochroma carphineum]|nr:MAG: hypothetical protein LQ338_001623 [Usnochroma carphineum]